MNTLIILVYIAFSLLVIADGQFAGNVEIENCSTNVIDIREKKNNTILCKGFNQKDIIAWSFKRTGEEIPEVVARCYPSSNCFIQQPDHFAAQRSESESTLFYQQYDRELDKVATITCKILFATPKRSKTCDVNVIHPAELSNCAVEEDRDSGTVNGSCRFEHAYSYRRGFLCTLYKEKDGMSIPLRSNIEYDSGSQSPGGWCAFTTTWVPGTYTYSINFYPGPGNITVTVGNIGPPDENGLPVGAIVGGIVAAVVVILVMVVVVVCIKRKRIRKPAGSANGSGDAPSKENHDFEEHVNTMYVTGEDADDTHSTDHKPSAIALRISPNSHNGHPATPHSLEADMYTTVDDEAMYAPNSAADRSGGNEDIGFGSNGSKRVPQTDEYAVVDKSRARKGPASSANTSASSPAHTTEASDEYAVVDKSSSRNKAAKNIASGLFAAATHNAGADVNAQVNKPAKKVKVAKPETEGANYAQVQKPKPATKPKTSAKPSSNKDVTESSAADDDEYHTLSHTRGSPHTQDQANLESQYSHIGND